MTTTDLSPETERRRAWMSLLATAPERLLSDLMSALGPAPEHRILRAPEVGGVMVRGRAGGTGAAFNMGEMTVTRCALRLADGTVGHGYVQGRSRDHATRAALVDALMQGAQAEEVEAKVLGPLRRARDEKREARAARAAATKVEFFTMARGED
ncbi:phosphonate metabolism protein PhnG [Oceanicola sp. 22II-s10i]|uniref:phosphonate C-P lyase system protein PhnG n=1 Tax=Oceanicola sp. 22II-s10i TaxID=1317116 RepID=UPI000B524538|nr:phosphonate C-P lyase system protein PhnG [Oceanicola sp. 22II-s10i]OWU85342.1 phosphonate metabolism protein PhnG [Oceanicola sp. 22II-s10i]